MASNSQSQSNTNNQHQALVHHHRGKIRAANPGAALPQVKAVKKIHRLYNDGEPLFTKAALQDLASQLQKAKPGESVRVQALDESHFDFEMETGRIVKNNPPRKLVTKPYIEYRSYQDMYEPVPQFYVPELALCSITVSHYMYDIDPTTEKPVSAPVAPYESVEAFLSKARKDWEKHAKFEELRTVLTDNLKAKVKKVVGFNLGWIARNLQSAFARNNTLQHALLLSLREIFESPKEVLCYSQDALYTSMDQAVLANAGIRAVDNPYGLLEVDNETVLYSPAARIPVKQIIAEIARPAVIIWGGPQVETEITIPRL